ncbi:MAG: iron transporter [Bifidobacteriaceae bacterium]|nr:iron transporter [Bifidobacteriaceae bacterium]
MAFALTASLGGCSSDSSGSGDSGDSGDAAAPAPGDEGAAGFVEVPIGDDISLPPLEVAGVYFQPVDMEPAGSGLSAAESDFHIEADISAGENDLGYGVGNFVPNLTVDYEILNADGSQQQAGTFMQMNASDGPHYGANLALPAGEYTVRFIIHSPEENGHVLHVDKETGVEGKFWTEPLVAEWENFQWDGREW